MIFPVFIAGLKNLNILYQKNESMCMCYFVVSDDDGDDEIRERERERGEGGRGKVEGREGITRNKQQEKKKTKETF